MGAMVRQHINEVTIRRTSILNVLHKMNDQLVKQSFHKHQLIVPFDVSV